MGEALWWPRWAGGAQRTGLGRCGPAGAPPAQLAPFPPLSIRARRTLARSPWAVSLTHGLGHLQLLVEPLAQDLRHCSARASDRKQVLGTCWKPPAGRVLLLPKAPLLRKRIQAVTRWKATEKRGTRAQRRRTENPGLPPAGGNGMCAGAGGSGGPGTAVGST